MAASRPRSRRSAERLVSPALLLRAVPVGEADLVLTLFTRSRGVLAAAARSARKSARRFGALEPIHELMVDVELREGSEVGRLVESRIERARPRATATLERLDAAGRILRWLRRGSPAGVPEVAAWDAVSRALDALDDVAAVDAAAVLAGTGLVLLETLGWGLDLERCVACGRPCPDGAPAMIDPSRGGLMCRACGGARRTLSAAVRAELLAARREGPTSALGEAARLAALDLVDAVLEEHVAPTARRGDDQGGARR
jgi:DNA repair protein RecO (recombination protein O)